jgi:copper(I)-binding protein/predicted peroxiredoxin
MMAGSGIVYMVIHNNGATADKLVAAKSDVSEVAELHDHTMDENGVMRMRPVPEGYIEIPANGSVELKSGGLHVMLINLHDSLNAGETFPLTLKFEEFGEVVIEVPISDAASEIGEAMPMEMAETDEEAAEEPEAEESEAAAEEPAAEEPAEETAEEAAETEETAEETAAEPGIAPTPRAPEDLAGGLFVSLTTDNIDRAAMAIGFATKVLNNTDKPVTIFMNVQGVRWIDSNIPPNMHKSGKTIQEMLQKFMDDGGVALVCPVCMVNVGGLAEAEIMDGVIIGSPEYTWSAMFAEDVTIVSY